MAKSKSIKQQTSSLQRELKEIDGAIVSIKGAINNINGGIELITPERVALVERRENTKPENNEMLLNGQDRKNGNEIQKQIDQTIEEKYKSLSYYTSGGMYRKLYMAKQNKYMAGEFPNLAKSLKLFATDVCFGSFFAADTSTNDQFSIYKNGVQITEKNVKDIITSIINPPATSKEDIVNKSFTDLDFEAYSLSRQDGYSFIRVVPTKNVLTDLYIKYIMKKSKKDTRRSANESVKPKDKSSAALLNSYLREIGLETDITEKSDLSHLHKNILKSLPETLLSNPIKNLDVVDLPKDNNNKPRPCDGFEEHESYIHANESFREFAYRMLSGKGSTMAVYRNPGMESSEKRHVYSIGAGPTSLPPEVGMDIYNEIFSDSSYSVGMESEIFESTTDSLSKLNIFDEAALNSTTYEEIYAMNTTAVIDRIKLGIEGTINYGIEKHFLGNENISKPSMSFSPLENVIKSIIVSDSKIIAGIESEIVDSYTSYSKLTPGLESSVSKFSSINDVLSQGHVFHGSSSIKAAANTKFDESTRKITKMFDHIKGVNTVLLDNRRVIPIMNGNKNNGIFYIEKTHAEIEHLIATRSFMSSPLAGGDSTTSLFQLDEERKEETMGRLIFSDTIKPIIDRNMSTKFLRDNADLMFTIKELLEENEISRKDRSTGVFSDLGFFNLSKVSYIPANELVMYSNGENLGRSVFEEAFVPANAYILARESYLSWLLVDGKGFCILEVPKGLNDLSGEYGASHAERIIQENMCSRISLKTGSTDNLQLSRRFITLPVTDDSAGKLNVVDIKPPDFDIDLEMIGKWQEEATGIVGYPASLFSTLDGGGIELARKIESMNAALVLDITESQDRKQHSSNALATKLLHYRGGKEYEDYTVEWIAPRPARASNNIKKEMVVEKKETLEAYLDMFEVLLGAKTEWEVIKPYFAEVLKNDLFQDDKYLNNVEDYWKRAIVLAKTSLSSTVEEE
ncbi:MAG: hypothetical protein ACRCX2_39130 [Paraclostridium sp.]